MPKNLTIMAIFGQNCIFLKYACNYSPSTFTLISRTDSPSCGKYLHVNLYDGSSVCFSKALRLCLIFLSVISNLVTGLSSPRHSKPLSLCSCIGRLYTGKTFCFSSPIERVRCTSLFFILTVIILHSSLSKRVMTLSSCI